MPAHIFLDVLTRKRLIELNERRKEKIGRLSRNKAKLAQKRKKCKIWTTEERENVIK